ncbi:hypothetical protein Gpo141_00013650, partial [Globisporangium polare]
MSISSVDEPTPDELARFQSSMDMIERLQNEQPHAAFSLDTPFTLMANAEFEAFVARGSAHEQMKAMAGRLVVPQQPDVATNSTASRTLEAVSTATSSRGRKLKSEVTWSVNVDWQTKGCVTPIKDQGQCGACWAFATAAALESGHCIFKGSLPVLSEQELVSCSRNTASCDGSHIAWSYDWINRENGGSICTAASYPYTSRSGNAANCKTYEDPSFQCDRPNLGAYFYGGGGFADHTQLEAAVLKQPGASSLQCHADQLNHAILIVGYGTRDGIPYWKVKNQYGSNWGDNGYIYIERGYQGHKFGACGIENYGFYPVFRDSSDPGLSKRTTPARWGY